MSPSAERNERRVEPRVSRVERSVSRVGLIMGLLLFWLLLAAIVVALALGLDATSWWRIGAGRWLLGTGILALAIGAVVVVRKNW